MYRLFRRVAQRNNQKINPTLTESQALISVTVLESRSPSSSFSSPISVGAGFPVSDSSGTKSIVETFVDTGSSSLSMNVSVAVGLCVPGSPHPVSAGTGFPVSYDLSGLYGSTGAHCTSLTTLISSPFSGGSASASSNP